MWKRTSSSLAYPNYLEMNLHEGYAWFDEHARPDPGQQELWRRGLVIVENLFGFAIDAGVFVSQPPAYLLTKWLSQQQTLLASWVADDMNADPADVIATAKAEFIRVFCVPAVVVQVLEADGARLRKDRPDWAGLLSLGGSA